MFSKSLIQFSADGQGCVPSLLLDLSPNYGGGNEDDDDCTTLFSYADVCCSHGHYSSMETGYCSEVKVYSKKRA